MSKSSKSREQSKTEVKTLEHLRDAPYRPNEVIYLYEGCYALPMQRNQPHDGCTADFVIQNSKNYYALDHLQYVKFSTDPDGRLCLVTVSGFDRFMSSMPNDLVFYDLMDFISAYKL